MSRFSIIPAKALSDRRLSRTDLSVLNALGTFQNDKNGWCWPSHNTIAEVINSCKRTVIRSLDKLTKLEYLEKRHSIRKDGGQGSNEYRINFVFQDDDDDEVARPPSDRPVTPPSDKVVTPPVTKLCHSPSDKAMSPPYLKEPKEGTQSPLERKRADERKVSLEELSVDHLTDWIEQRKVSAKTPLTVNVELCLEQMKAHYLAAGGLDGGGRVVRDWVQKARQWVIEEEKRAINQRAKKNDNRPEHRTAAPTNTSKHNPMLAGIASAIASAQQKQRE